MFRSFWKRLSPAVQGSLRLPLALCVTIALAACNNSGGGSGNTSPPPITVGSSGGGADVYYFRR